jgi:hypothetical protein
MPPLIRAHPQLSFMLRMPASAASAGFYRAPSGSSPGQIEGHLHGLSNLADWKTTRAHREY